VDWFAKIGAPVESGLRRARLPVLFRERPHAWLSYRQVRLFVADMAYREGACDRGMPVAEMSRVFNRGLIVPVMAAPDLQRAIRQLSIVCKVQNSGVSFWLEPAGDMARLCLRLPLPTTFPGHAISELRTLHLIYQLLRAFAGPVFQPSRVLLTSSERQLNFDTSDVFEDLPTYANQGCSALEFPRSLLFAKGAGAGEPNNALLLNTDATAQFRPLALCDLLATLLEPYLAEGHPDIQLAAALMGCSVRTLQRRLGEAGITYSALIDSIRASLATRMLREGELELNVLASNLGYSEQSAFTRAFRRWTGTTPAHYRSAHIA
jgi:AraC-like DNA-binding protein